MDTGLIHELVPNVIDQVTVDDRDINSHKNKVCRRYKRDKHREMTCFSKIIGQPRNKRTFENRERNSQDAIRSSHENVSVVKQSPIDTVATTKRLTTGKPVNREPRIERISVVRLLIKDKNRVVRSMNHNTAAPKKESEANNSRKGVIKSHAFEEYVTKFEALVQLGKIYLELLIGQLRRRDSMTE